MRIIGVTGGIGSGKSTVSKYLASRGAEIIDADQIARDITAKGHTALKELQSHFGDNIINPDGTLNRKKLAEFAFSDKKEVDVLNSITHKHIAGEIIKRLDHIVAENCNDIVVIDAPIPIQHGFLDTVDEVWVIAAEKETRIKRVMQRSGFSYSEALDRINAQMKDEDYFRIANHILYNNGSEDDLKNEIVKILAIGDRFGDKKTE